MSAAPRRARSLAVLAILLAGFGLSGFALAGCARTVRGTAFAPSLALGDKLQHAMDAVTSVHLEMHIGIPQLQITASGDEKLDQGSAQAFVLTEYIPGAGDIKVIDIDNQLYAKLPGAMNPTSKPWVHIRPDTTDPALVPLAQALAQIQQSASLRQYSLFAQSASNFRDVGSSEANGIQCELYTFDVLISRLPQDLIGMAALRSARVRSLPIRLWVDDQGRVRRMTEALSVAGQQTSTRIDFSKFDAPVVISAPPADQVATH